MAKQSQGTMHDEILSPMASGMGDGGSANIKNTDGGTFYGLDEPYTKGTPTKMPEISFDNSGAFGKVPKENH